MNRRIGNPYQEALRALSEQVSRVYREELGTYRVAASLIQGNSLIAITVVFDGTGTECWVPLELGDGLSHERRARIEHEASHVVGKRLELDRFTADFVSSKIQGVLDGYR